MEQAVSDVSDLRDPSPFRVALNGHLDKIHLAALAYWRNPDAALPAQVDRSEKDFADSLNEFKKQNPHLFPGKAAEQIQDVFTQLSSAVSDLLKFTTDRAQKHSAGEQNFAQGLWLIDNRLRPLIRKSPESAEHLDALLKIENQLRAWQQSLTESWPTTSAVGQAQAYENENKGETLIALYLEQEGLRPGERTSMRALKSLWTTNNDLSRQDFALGAVQAQAQDRTDASYKKVQETLIHTLPSMPTEELELRKTTLLKSMRLHMILAGALALGGIAVMAACAVAAWRFGKAHPFESKAPLANKAPAVEKPIMKMDLEGKIVDWSPAAEKMYEYETYEITGQAISRLFASENEMARLYKEMKSSPILQFETQHKAKSGVVFPVRIDFRPITEKGRVVAIGLICHRR
jgi:PAS domain S-box-containing protein